jgi:hypothetical protein
MLKLEIYCCVLECRRSCPLSNVRRLLAWKFLAREYVQNRNGLCARGIAARDFA